MKQKDNDASFVCKLRPDNCPCTASQQLHEQEVHCVLPDMARWPNCHQCNSNFATWNIGQAGKNLGHNQPRYKPMAH